MSRLWGVPVSEIRASQEWLDRIEANPNNYLTPENRLFLQLPRRLDPFQLRGIAMVTIGSKTLILDARTDEEKEADTARLNHSNTAEWELDAEIKESRAATMHEIIEQESAP